jgi:hypothetical protein
MANEDKKDFNAMLHDNKDMPKSQFAYSIKIQKELKIRVLFFNLYYINIQLLTS